MSRKAQLGVNLEVRRTSVRGQAKSSWRSGEVQPGVKNGQAGCKERSSKIWKIKKIKFLVTNKMCNYLNRIYTYKADQVVINNICG